MGYIARKDAADAQSVKTHGDSPAVLAFILLILAVATPIAASRASDTAPPPHTHRHLPTPAPTPMALPPDVKAKVPAYKPGPLPFHDGEQLIFQASWIGIPAAQARIELHKSPKDPSRWIGETWIETSPYADLVYRMRDYVRESVAEDTLHTNGIYIVQHEKSRLNYYDVTIDRTAQIVTMTKKNRKGTQIKEYIASDPWGPISGAMMALTQDLEPGRTYAFDVFSGSQRYVFAFEVEKREQIHLALGDFDAWRIVPDVWYVSDGQLRNQAHGTVLWISADPRHLPLRIEAQAFIGYVRADLIKVDGKGGVESAQK